MKHFLNVIKVFFISLYNFLVGLPEVYDVQVKGIDDPDVGKNANEYGTLVVRPFQKALYSYVIRSSNGKKEKSKSVELKVFFFDHTLLLTLGGDVILHGKAVKADDGSFIIKGPGNFRNKPLSCSDTLFFERLWDMPYDV